MKTAIIIVLYNPTYEILKNIYALSKESEENELIILDNSSIDNKVHGKNITYVPLLNNHGIAYAQNIGIKIAKEKFFKFILFLDQDSKINPCFLDNLVSEFIKIKSIYPNLGALGPLMINGRKNKENNKTFGKDKIDNLGFSKKLHLASSGTLVDIEIIDKIGNLEETLFIDYVDNEWCWRMNKNNFIVGITNKIIMEHYIGNDEVKFFNSYIPISTPFRYYYQTRNYLWLLRRRYVPWKWKIGSLIKKTYFLIVSPFLVKQWKEIYKFSFKGLIDGLKFHGKK